MGNFLTREVSLHSTSSVVAKERCNLSFDSMDQGGRSELLASRLVLDDLDWQAGLGCLCVGRIEDVDEEISLLDSDHCGAECTQGTSSVVGSCFARRGDKI